jgi:hypothetical protein
MEAAAVENQQDIDLACRTIEWIGSLNEHEIRNWEATRTLLANLCHFQDLFAEPLILPFQLGPDLSQRLYVHRPKDVLIRFNINPDIPQDYLPTVAWIGTLFELFESSLKFEEDRKIIPRRLVACWYHIASQLDYTPEANTGDNIDNDELFAQTLGLLVESKAQKFSESLFNLMNDDNYNSEEDSDYDPEGSREEEDEEIAEAQPVISDDSGRISEKEKQIRAILFSVVQGLGAYMPSPKDDLPWFKRSLKHIHYCQKVGDTSWYPWGCPPVVALIDSLKSTDPHQACFAGTILQLFKQSTETNISDQPDDDDENDTDYVPS